MVWVGLPHTGGDRPLVLTQPETYPRLILPEVSMLRARNTKRRAQDPIRVSDESRHWPLLIWIAWIGATALGYQYTFPASPQTTSEVSIDGTKAKYSDYPVFGKWKPIHELKPSDAYSYSSRLATVRTESTESTPTDPVLQIQDWWQLKKSQNTTSDKTRAVRKPTTRDCSPIIPYQLLLSKFSPREILSQVLRRADFRHLRKEQEAVPKTIQGRKPS